MVPAKAVELVKPVGLWLQLDECSRRLLFGRLTLTIEVMVTVGRGRAGLPAVSTVRNVVLLNVSLSV